MKKPATITPEMIECLAELQTYGMIQGYIDLTEQTIDYVLDDNPPGNDANLQRIQMIQSLRMLGKDLKKFLVT